MNETIKILLERRSIRAYKPEQIKDADIEVLLEVGKYAPSAMNSQPWHFTVLQNHSLMSKISETIKAQILASGNEQFMAMAKKPEFSSFHNAPTAIIISGVKGHYAMSDCANAAENMVVAAHALNLGSCYTASFTMAFDSSEGPALIKELGIPEGYTPMFAICLGYTDGSLPEAAPRKEGTVNYIR